MKKWIVMLIAGVMASSALSDYLVLDVQFTGSAVGETEESYAIGKGKMRGLIVIDEDSGDATFIECLKGEYIQGDCSLDIYDYETDSYVKGDTYVEKGINEIWFDVYSDDVNVWGVALGTYVVQASELGYSVKASGKGSGSVLIDEWYGGYLKSSKFKVNSQLTEGINAAKDAEAFMEQAVKDKVKVEEVDLDWSWNLE